MLYRVGIAVWQLYVSQILARDETIKQYKTQATHTLASNQFVSPTMFVVVN